MGFDRALCWPFYNARDNAIPQSRQYDNGTVVSCGGYSKGSGAKGYEGSEEKFLNFSFIFI